MVRQQRLHHRFQTTKKLPDLVIGIKGAGEMASGVALGLHQANIRKLFMVEVQHPLAVRRTVSFCEAVHAGRCKIEGVEAQQVKDVANVYQAWENGAIAVIQDPEWNTIPQVKPDVVIDATLAKVNLGTTRAEAKVVIGMGPGFEAGKDVHMVIETHRGHNLGRIIHHGAAHPNTGIPGDIGGYSHQRVLRAPSDGIFESQLEIGAMVKEGQIIGRVGGQAVKSQISGVLRGLIRPDSRVQKGLKVGDIDPRGDLGYCDTVSDKARALGGSVLQAILSQFNTRDSEATDLAGGIGLTGKGVVSLIGAGGKTSLMFKLANELVRTGRSVLTTTTTKIFIPEKVQSPHTIVASTLEDLLARLSLATETLPHVTIGKKIEKSTGKLLGVTPDIVDRIWQAGLFDVIIIESDGSRQLPLKASAAHEPVIPKSTSHLIYVTGLDAIGNRVEDTVHRPKMLMQNLSLAPEATLTEDNVADAVLLEVRKADKLCRSLTNTVVLNKADNTQREDQGRMIADRLKRDPLIHQIVVVALNAEKPVKFVYRS